MSLEQEETHRWVPGGSEEQLRVYQAMRGGGWGVAYQLPRAGWRGASSVRRRERESGKDFEIRRTFPN